MEGTIHQPITATTVVVEGRHIQIGSIKIDRGEETNQRIGEEVVGIRG